MCQADLVVSKHTAEQLDQRHRAIHAAAIEQFTLRGIAGTSMANIADAAGMSRPALYQHFRNKGDIYASAFVALFEEHVDLALTALVQPGSTVEQLDGFLQRYEGDLWQLLAASPHSEEILGAKSTEVAASIGDVVARLWTGMADHLAKIAVGRSRAIVERRAGWVEILRFSPRGLVYDQPTIAVYRRRLNTLASSVAADVDSI